MVLFGLMQLLSHSLELSYFVLFTVAKSFTLCLEVDLSLLLPNTALMLRSYYFLAELFFFFFLIIAFLLHNELISYVVFSPLYIWEAAYNFTVRIICCSYSLFFSRACRKYLYFVRVKSLK